MSAREAARVWLWIAYWASHEEDALLYAYPRPDGWESKADRLATARRRCVETATELLGGTLTEEAWRDAVETFSNPDFSR